MQKFIILLLMNILYLFVELKKVFYDKRFN